MAMIASKKKCAKKLALTSRQIFFLQQA